MKHQAQTEEQIAEAGLLQEGVYDFTIAEASEYTSDKGNETFKLKLHVFDMKGEARTILDWVTPAFPKKFKHLHDALGLMDLYNKMETAPSDILNKSGKLMLARGDPYTDKNGNERINNAVVDYVKRENMPNQVLPKSVEEDEIPFG